MASLRRVARELGLRAGLFGLVQAAVRRREVVIVTFHRFAAAGENATAAMPIESFARAIEYLTQHYRVTSLHTVADELRRGAVSPYTLAVTVDDGYHEVFTLAAPILKRYGVPASFFVISDFIDGRLWPWTDRFDFVFQRAPRERVVFRHRDAVNVLELRGDEDRKRAGARWLGLAKRLEVAERDELLAAIADAAGIEIPVAPPPAYRPMTWTELRALAADGFDVGAHTRTHPILSCVGPAELRAEVGGCKEQMEQRLGFRVSHFAYPNGGREDYTAEAVAAVAGAGYAAAVTTIFGGNTPATPPFELRRIAGRPEDLAHFAQSVSGFDELRMRATRRADQTSASPSPAGSMAGTTGRE